MDERGREDEFAEIRDDLLLLYTSLDEQEGDPRRLVVRYTVGVLLAALDRDLHGELARVLLRFSEVHNLNAEPGTN